MDENPRPSGGNESVAMEGLKIYETEHIESADALWAAITPQLTDNIYGTVYRGQSDANWNLVPKVFREEGGVTKYFAKAHLTVYQQICYEAEMLKFFLGQCDRIGLPVPNDSIARRRFLNAFKESIFRFKEFPDQWPTDEWLDIMPLAQHHGVPTRLLDWTRRAHVAAYFAAADAIARHPIRPGKRLAIWALQTSELERLTLESEPQDIAFRRLFADEADGMDLPPPSPPGIRVVSAPGATSTHVAAQASVFTLQRERGAAESCPIGQSLDDELCKARGVLRKWTLPVTEASKLLRLCYSNEISAATVFRTYDGAGKAVIDWLEDMSEGGLGRHSQNPIVPPGSNGSA